jgi:hypothetical protein
MNKTCGKCKINKSTDQFHKDSSKISGFTSYCKECKTLYRKNNIEQFRARKLKWYQKKKLQKSLIPKQKKIKDKNYKPAHKLKRKEKERLQRQTDLNFRMLGNLRTRIYHAMKKDTKGKKTKELLGCSIQELKIYLESKFREGMSWGNYGKYGWHIDHIIPCSMFDLTNLEQQKKCFHYSNLQPLWAVENLKKYNKSSVSIL